MTRQWRLATFNIESLDFKPSRAAGFEARIIALRPLLQRINADVLCLQEVNAQKIPGQKDRGFAALDMLLCDTQYTTFYRATSHDPDTGSASDVHNLVILSRWPMSNKRQLHHDLVPPLASPFTEYVLRWDRPVQMADLTLPDGRTLHVVNLHLRAPRAVPLHAANKMAQPAHGSEEWAKGFYLAAAKRQGQALEARLAIEKLFDANPDALIAVCGDLNSDVHETPAKILCASAADMSDERSAPVSGNRSLTPLDARVSEATRFSVLHDGRAIMLDHILASRALTHVCGSVEVFNADLQDEFSAQEMVPTSFHAPVVATFATDERGRAND